MELRFFEIYRNPDYLILLLEGAGLSFGITMAGAIYGMLLALTLAALRYHKVPVLAQLSTGYVEFIRNTPLIVQLFFVAFGLPLLLGYRWPFWAILCWPLVSTFRPISLKSCVPVSVAGPLPVTVTQPFT